MCLHRGVNGRCGMQHIQVGVLSAGHNQIQIKSNLHPSKEHAGYFNQKDEDLNEKWQVWNTGLR